MKTAYATVIQGFACVLKNDVVLTASGGFVKNLLTTFSKSSFIFHYKCQSLLQAK